MTLDLICYFHMHVFRVYKCQLRYIRLMDGQWARAIHLILHAAKSVFTNFIPKNINGNSLMGHISLLVNLNDLQSCRI